LTNLNKCVYFSYLIHIKITMRTNIVIDDELMSEALKLSGCETKKSVIEKSLKLLIQISKQENIRNFRGQLTWHGDLDKMRTDNDTM